MGDECRTMGVPKAGKLFFGLSRNGSYDAAKRGDIPTIRIGRKLRVPIAALERMLDAAGEPVRAARSEPCRSEDGGAPGRADKRGGGLSDEHIEAIGRAAVAETNAKYAARRVSP